MSNKIWRIRCSAMVEGYGLGYLYWNGVAWSSLSRTAKNFNSEKSMLKEMGSLSMPRTAKGTMKGYEV